MGGLSGGIYDLISGDPAQAQEEKLGQSGDYGINTGQGLVTPAAAWDEAILSGDPTRIATALAPEISAGQTGAQQQKNQVAQFGTRGGGTGAATQAIDAGTRANIINLTGGLQERTAANAGNLGLNLIGQGSNDVGNVARMKTTRRSQVLGDIGGIEKTAAAIAGGVMGGAAGGGGDGPARISVAYE